MDKKEKEIVVQEEPKGLDAKEQKELGIEASEIKEEVKELNEESTATKEVVEAPAVENTPPPPKKQHKDELVQKVETIKEDIETIYKEYKEVLDKFESASVALAAQENTIINSTLKTTQELLEKLHAPNIESVDDTISQIQLDNKKEILEVKYPSKGRFKGFFLGAATALLSLAAIGAYGAKLANLPLNITTFTQKSNLDLIVSKYLELFNIKLPLINGYLILGGVSLLVGFITYKLVTFTQKFKNRKYVQHLEENAKEYKKELLEQIEELNKLIEQIEKIKELNEKYDVLLQEQNAKLKRILFFEKPESFEDLHTLSKAEVEKTELLLKELLKLMNTPVAKDNKLNEESIRNFLSAMSVLEENLKKLY